MSLNISSNIEASAHRLFPNQSLEQAVSQMLLERAQKNLIKYQTVIHQFQEKYGMDFETFRKKTISSQPIAEEEQDYFDWELAITGITDMQAEIYHLRDSI